MFLHHVTHFFQSE